MRSPMVALPEPDFHLQVPPTPGRNIHLNDLLTRLDAHSTKTEEKRVCAAIFSFQPHSKSRAPHVLPGSGVDFHQLSLLDKQRHGDHFAGLEGCWLLHIIGAVASDSLR